MKLTDKTEKEFFEWLEKQPFYIHEFVPTKQNWNTIPDSMKWGVYVDFFDWNGVYISLESESPSRFKVDVWSFEIIEESNDLETRQEARTKAIEIANEIYNKL